MWVLHLLAKTQCGWLGQKKGVADEDHQPLVPKRIKTMLLLSIIALDPESR